LDDSKSIKVLETRFIRGRFGDEGEKESFFFLNISGLLHEDELNRGLEFASYFSN